MNLSKRQTVQFVALFSLVGGSLPIVIYATSFVPAISEIWWWHELIIYLWPTFVLIMGFSGQVDFLTWVAVLVSALANAFVYAVCAVIVVGVLHLILRLRSKPVEAPKQF
jgi:hypothetical protein